MKFLVLRGKANPGNIDCEYVISDIIEFNNKFTDSLEPLIEFQKDYAYSKFIEMGAKESELDEDVAFFRKNVMMDNGNAFAELCAVYQHTHTYFIFVPLTEVLKFF